MARIRYGEGDWFALPLRRGGFAVGVIARANSRGVLFGYFFGPRHESIPMLTAVAGLAPHDAVLVRKFGDLGLKEGEWPIIGRLNEWDRRDWPMPAFVRYEELTNRSFLVSYDDNDPNKLVEKRQVPPGEQSLGPKDGLMGAGFTEETLTALIG